MLQEKADEFLKQTFSTDSLSALMQRKGGSYAKKAILGIVGRSFHKHASLWLE